MTCSRRTTRPDDGHNNPGDQTFHFFSQLPPELRVKIWEYSMPPPRIVSVRCGARTFPKKSSRESKCSRTYRSSNSASTSTPPWCTSPAPLPATLAVCQESRFETLRHYAPMFGIARQPGHVYFDPSRDILFFGPREGYMAAEAELRTLLVLADPDELAVVQRVALSETVLGSSSSSSFSFGASSTNLTVDVILQLKMRLPSLRELIVVPHDGNESASMVYSSNTALVPLPLPPTTFPLAGPAVPEFYGLDMEFDTSLATGPATHLALQIHTAMRRVCAEAPGWVPPRWRILAISNSNNNGSNEKERSKRIEERRGSSDRRVSTSSSSSSSHSKKSAKKTSSAVCCRNSTASLCDCCGRSGHNGHRNGASSRKSTPKEPRPSCGQALLRDGRHARR